MIKNINLLNEKLFFKIGFLGVIYIILKTLIDDSSNIGIILLIIGSLPFIKKYKLNKNQKLFCIFIVLSILTYINEREILLDEIRKVYKYIPFLLIPLFIDTFNRTKIIFITIMGMLLINCGKIYLTCINNGFNFIGTYDGLFGLNYTSQPMASLSFFVLGLIFFSFLKKKKIFLIVSLISYIIILYFIVLGQRRGAYLALLIPLIVVVFLILKKKMLLVVLIGILGTGIFMQTDYIKSNIYYKRFTSIKNIHESSPSVRILLWKMSTNIYKESPVIGLSKDEVKKYGIDYFEKNKISIEKQLPKYGIEDLKYQITHFNMHSLYFQSILDMGLIGIYFIGLLFYILYQNLKLILSVKNQEYYILFLSTFGSLLSLMVLGLTESIWFVPVMRKTLILCLSIFILTERNYMKN